MNIVDKAMMYARGAHYGIGQRRKYTNAPYFTHPASVAMVVRLFGGTEEQIAAAYLHDVVEDTSITPDEIDIVFGYEVGNLVYWLSDVSKKEDGNRAKRKEIDRNHIAQAPAEAQFIKCADLLDNTKSIVEHDPDFAKVYLKEKLLLLEAMTKVHNTKIYEAALLAAHLGIAKLP